MPSTYAHPWQPDAGPAFFFEIDLDASPTSTMIGCAAAVDNQHLTGSAGCTSSTTRSRIRRPAGMRGEAGIRADGSHPANGAVDLVNAPPTVSGRCRGRYLRPSSDSPVRLSSSARGGGGTGRALRKPSAAAADGRDLEVGAPSLRIPANTRRLTLRLSMSGGSSREAPFLWRRSGYHEDWQNERSLQFDFPCPPPAPTPSRRAVLCHDGRFDASVLSLPVIIAPASSRPPPSTA
ncbi:MAG: hypothetical protein U1F77_09400 [Kiritimatiellia bacterium]